MDEFVGRLVTVHHNLHNGSVVVCDLTRKVLGYADAVLLEDVTFRVSETVRLKIVETGRRRVHAYLKGRLVSAEGRPDTSGLVRVTYNPHRCGSFTVSGTGEIVTQAERLVVTGGYCYLQS